MFDLSSLSTGEDIQTLMEQECLLEGGLKYREKTTHLIQQKFESRADYGKKLIATGVEPLAEALGKWLEEAKGPGRSHIASKYLSLVDPRVAAFITLRIALDGVTTREWYQSTAKTIGMRIEEELKFTYFEEQNKGLWITVNRNLDEENPESFKSSIRRKAINRAMKKFDVLWKSWTPTDRFHVGSKMIDLLITSTGYLRLVKDEQSCNTGVYLQATDLLAEKLSDWRDRSEVMHPERQPMVCPPLPWETVKGGGYLTERAKTKLVKTQLHGHLIELANADMPSVYRAVNALQDTPWKVNARMLDAVKAVWDAGIEVGDMPSRLLIPKPPAPEWSDTDPVKQAAWKKWKAYAAETFRTNRRLDSKRTQTVRIIQLAEKYREFPAIWFPVRLDFRGRMYLVPQYLNPQSSDLSKGLLTFAVGKPLGERGAVWLAIHLANTWGNDKVSLDDRRGWAYSNTARILRTAKDPLSDLWWTEADKPFQFLAACIEWEGYMEQGLDYECALPIMIDGSCNGLQHFAAMLRDEVCGRHVNLVPQDKPADIYAEVARKVEEILRLDTDTSVSYPLAQKWLDYGIDRGLTKRPTMVLPYGGTIDSVNKYVELYVEEQHYAEMQRAGTGKLDPFSKAERKRAIAHMASVIWRAMGEVVVGPRAAMDWLRKACRVVAAENLPISWTTPTGFVVAQQYRSLKKNRIETKIGEGITMRFTLAEETNQLDKKKQSTAMPPNFVHSLDAAALMLTIETALEKGVSCFAAIHDSYGTHPADMDTLSAVLREVFVKMYSERDVLGEVAAELGRLPALEGKAIPALPPKGELDIAGVLRSDFFFA